MDVSYYPNPLLDRFITRIAIVPGRQGLNRRHRASSSTAVRPSRRRSTVLTNTLTPALEYWSDYAGPFRPSPESQGLTLAMTILVRLAPATQPPLGGTQPATATSSLATGAASISCKLPSTQSNSKCSDGARLNSSHVATGAGEIVSEPWCA